MAAVAALLLPVSRTEVPVRVTAPPRVLQGRLQQTVRTVTKNEIYRLFIREDVMQPLASALRASLNCIFGSLMPGGDTDKDALDPMQLVAPAAAVHRPAVGGAVAAARKAGGRDRDRDARWDGGLWGAAGALNASALSSLRGGGLMRCAVLYFRAVHYAPSIPVHTLPCIASRPPPCVLLLFASH
jgi:hypothetical protein